MDTKTTDTQKTDIQTTDKCVIILDDSLPAGLIANTAAILGITLGKERPDIVGPDVSDRSGNLHRGITALPIPILRGDPAMIRALRARLYEPEFDQVVVVDFTHLAQTCGHYREFTEKLSKNDSDDLAYMGIGLCGPKKKINKLTGGIPLLR